MESIWKLTNIFYLFSDGAHFPVDMAFYGICLHHSLRSLWVSLSISTECFDYYVLRYVTFSLENVLPCLLYMQMSLRMQHGWKTHIVNMGQFSVSSVLKNTYKSNASCPF